MNSEQNTGRIISKDIARQIVKKILNPNQDNSIETQLERVRLSRGSDAEVHLNWARQALKENNFLRARVEYMKAVECYKQFGDKEMQDKIQKEYDEFVKIDPIFKALLKFLVKYIKDNPAVTQAEIGKNYQSIDWMGLYDYNRPIAKEDIYYALYFADKFGTIKRIKKGRTYLLEIS